MKNLTSKELRELYLRFFRERGHTVIPSASLIPENDPTVLFTTAGTPSLFLLKSMIRYLRLWPPPR